MDLVRVLLTQGQIGMFHSFVACGQVEILSSDHIEEKAQNVQRISRHHELIPAHGHYTGTCAPHPGSTPQSISRFVYQLFGLTHIASLGGLLGAPSDEYGRSCVLALSPRALHFSHEIFYFLPQVPRDIAHFAGARTSGSG
jgi:hypothetical protein